LKSELCTSGRSLQGGAIIILNARQFLSYIIVLDFATTPPFGHKHFRLSHINKIKQLFTPHCD
jgi:hypothetical protein